ncbi:DUF916 domain-containing protein [Actinoplanes sp. L3-i22]|uniref:DUF916 domain-containing protein n=1 Tax=Actinoplanes sp. L3-i22 TaxID=2836373 RepID=UPI001C7816F2|nr:DUF916 domain-containing protein [Actinoplanes sp. L3-i22]BCY08513.1 hypothetical protein L3i22_036010 [Actinoplanes sp. L3-i22]
MKRLLLAVVVAALGIGAEPTAATAAPASLTRAVEPAVAAAPAPYAWAAEPVTAATPATRARAVAAVAASRARAVASVAAFPAWRVESTVAAAPASLTWTVQPATAAGPDGRRWIERTLDPGQQVTEYLAVRNFSDVAGTFALKAADGYLTENGRFNMLPSSTPSKDGGTWIKVPAKISVAAKATALVPFTITVPQGAAPGDHPAGIAATVLSNSGTVQVESRVGFRVLLRASGAVRRELSATSVSVHYKRSWNPLRPGRMEISYTTINSGNIQVDGQARVKVSTPFGSTATETNLGPMLPGNTRTIQAEITKVWAVGRVRTTLSLVPATAAAATTTADGAATAASADAANTTAADATALAGAAATVTTWVMPWPQLLLLGAAIGLLLLLRRVIRQRRARLHRLLEQARLEGRRSATDPA